jgi:DNA polymerase V
LDCNSFYCACEQAFAPDLRGRQLIVLSNNDSCTIARTPQAKAVGVKMGEPWHQIVRRPECKNVVWKSSNYTLYGDLSRRVYQVIEARTPALEPYSIDESFFDVTGIPDAEGLCRRLRDEVLRITKIPTCVGIGPTKTIAKLANRIAKASPVLLGVCDLTDPRARHAAYESTPLRDVWGLGEQTIAKLERSGVQSIPDFVALPPMVVKDLLSVTGARVHAELKGIACIPLSAAPAPRQGIAVTRAFGRPVEAWTELLDALAHYVTSAAAKARAEGLEVTHISVILQTNHFSADDHQYSNQASAQIEPTISTGILIREAERLLKRIWRPGFRYAKTGVMFWGLQPAGKQSSLLLTHDPEKAARSMAAMDAINARYGRGALRPASLSLSKTWSARALRLSPRYTTRLSEILRATAF